MRIVGGVNAAKKASSLLIQASGIVQAMVHTVPIQVFQSGFVVLYPSKSFCDCAKYFLVL